jgi:CMP-N-acetylneuraminic acid synthetase
LRRPWHLKEAFEIIKKKKADSVVGVVEIPGHFSPYWAITANESGLGELFLGGAIRNRIPRRQSFPKKAYANSGHVYIFKTELLESPEANFYGDKVAVYPIEEKYAINIDGPGDWELAERAMDRLKSGR